MPYDPDFSFSLHAAFVQVRTGLERKRREDIAESRLPYVRDERAGRFLAVLASFDVEYGNLTRTVVETPGAEATVSRPPTMLTRSTMPATP